MTRTSARSARLKKARFLSAFRQSCNVTWAADQTGVGRRTVYDWRTADPDFEEQYLDAEAAAWDHLEHAVRCEAMPHDVVIEEEGVLTDRRGNPVIDLNTGLPRYVVVKRVRKREMNHVLAMFLLKAHDPQRYRERFDINHSGQVGIQIDALDAAVARLEALELPPVEPAALPDGPAPRTFTDGQGRAYLT